MGIQYGWQLFGQPVKTTGSVSSPSYSCSGGLFQQKLCVNPNFHQMQMWDAMRMRRFWLCTAFQLRKGACLRDDFFYLPLFLSLGNQQTGIGLFPVSLFFRNSGDCRNWGLLCRNVLQAAFCTFRRFHCWWESKHVAEWRTMGDVRPVDYYGNEVTQMFRKKKKTKHQNKTRC